VSKNQCKDTYRVFAGESGERAMPMGIALYQAGRGEVHAIVSRKSGPKQGYLHQYRLAATRGGRVGVQLVRAFGAFSGEGEIEALCVDSELGYVYYADENVGIRKYHADPRMPEREIALFATDYNGDQEGIALYAPPNGAGYLLCTSKSAEAASCTSTPASACSASRFSRCRRARTTPTGWTPAHTTSARRSNKGWSSP
jgi:3-phytase